MLEILNTVVYVIAIASVISSITPTKKDDVFMAKVMKYVDMLSLNIGAVRTRLRQEEQK